ncbi:MAG: 2-succinyl-5-enolpyruvyl-6-hydroxy-3-cyclohexene-1-carboxylate synthase [Aeriscardovia sp.]|nr:2-succinyl-5-enolpyruvyl-6-hydroxy-3-cyclohexene-1-carboxylate synthase [Aeriscardovia sp.]
MSEQKKYFTDERNVQILISLLKEHGIHRVIASPGTTNMTFVGSIQNDPFFQIWSCVDERSAAYMACGMADETGEPVVLSCTGATASRNYMPGLTEAYYRKLPILAITSYRGESEIGHLKDQQIDRRSLPNDIAVESVNIPLVKDKRDEHYCIIEGNKAILALTQRGGGPVHINLMTAYSRNFTTKEIIPARKIMRYTKQDVFPEIPQGRIAIFVGAHKPFSEQETKSIDDFCAKYDAVVFTSHISGYHGKYQCNFSLVCGQKEYFSPLRNIDQLIHLGEVSGNTYHIKGKETWRISEDGAIRDTFGNLTKVFEMSPYSFFEQYNKDAKQTSSDYLESCKKEYQRLFEMIPDLPFSNIWIAQHTIQSLPEGCEFFMGILNSLRSWNFFQLPPHINAHCNVGGYGIDGGVSTMIGASLANPNKLYIGVFGDLAFFYDMNCLGNRHVGNNVRIMLINNGRGTEFRNYGHPCYPYGEGADIFMAAAGHFGNKSHELVKHYSQDLGFEYLSASNKEEYLSAMVHFTDCNIGVKPILLEVFTEMQNESDALKTMLNLIPKDPQKSDFRTEIKSKIKNVIGEKAIRIAKIIKE